MSSNQGYSSIPRNDEEGGGSSSDPLLPSHTKSSWPERADGFKQFVKRNLAYIVVVFIVAVLLGIVLFSSLLPESSLLPKGHQPFTVKSGVSEITMQHGREKCEAIKNRRREKNKPDSSRVKNPRADPNQKPILLKNAVVWDGQGNVLEDVDIYIESGVIRQVEKNISLDSNKDVKVIDVAGHVVSPGLVDMHR
ncbi:hypothetical protein RMCBS344292_19001 [Rhizopus microsporus]|nr:hypothetical protein RMCBS344292_18618 [Rhizopus microsporus]CEJ05053.1 hypothetical protein RMCBS344292_19001 [Rhizopus microsporus]